MKRKVNIIALISLTAVSVTAASVGVLSWFETRVDVGLNDNITGVANGAYFADGDGSSDHPFIINTPRHLYNLAWLQYLGYFNNNLVGPASGPVYFALDENLQGPLNMGGLTIPPIGTTQFPFWGYFDGNNKTILNLKVDNVVDKTSNDHINKTPSAIKEKDALFSGGENDKVLRESTGGPTHFSNDKPVNVMGMFGQTDTIDSTDVEPHIFDFTLDSATISSSSSSLLVGVAAGYLDSKMKNVAVKGPSIDITNTPSVYHGSNLSEYTLVGYATESFVTKTKEKKVTAQKPLVDNTVRSGAGSEFGASIPMKDIYNHLLDVHNSAEPLVYNEVWNGEIGVNPEQNLTKDPIPFYANPSRRTGEYYLYGNQETDSGGEEIASYTFARRPGTNAFMYLYGKDSGSYTKNIDGIAYEEAINGGMEFVIGDGEGNWLTYSKATSDSPADDPYDVLNTTDVSQAQKWKYENGEIRSADYKSYHTEQSGIFGNLTFYHYAYLSLSPNDTLGIVVGTEQNDYTGWTFGSQESQETTVVENEDGTTTEVTQDVISRVAFASASGEASAYLVFENGWNVSLVEDDYKYLVVGNKFLRMQVVSNNITSSLTDNIDLATKMYSTDYGGYRFLLNGTWYMFVTTIRETGRHGGTLAQQVITYAVDSSFAIVPVSDYDSTLMVAFVPETHNSADYLGTSFTIVTSARLTIRGYVGTSTSYHYCLKINQNTGSISAVSISNNNYATATPIAIRNSEIDLSPYALTFQTGSRTENADWNSSATYFPLSYANNGIDVHEKNTGYIISGSHYNQNDYKGDIRVSDYVNNGTTNRLSASLGGNSTYNNLTILTHEKGADGGYVAIKDQYNSGLANVPNGLRNVATTFKSPTGEGGLDFVRYEDSREELHNQFTTDFSHIHGLHFMNAEISMSNLITIPHAHLLGEEHENYQMPEDCIDFNLKKNGFITFYAGTYFPGNTTFFSLHQIERNESGAITSIKEIDKIYDNVGENRKNKRYLYDYRGGAGNNVGEGDQKGDQLFDMAWVTNPSWVDNAVYYFEIPVNSGEYALGSVSGKQGAYLMYLDIGSARKNENITTIEEDILTENKLSTYVDGVDFKDASAIGAGKGGLTANITIPASSNGTFTYSYDDDNSTLTCTGSGLTATHVGEGVTLSGATDTREDGDTVRVEKTTRITYDDFNETVTTTVSETTTINNGTPTTTNSENIDYNVLEYDVEVQMQTAEGDLIIFRYWGDASFTTEVDFEHSIYTITFDTDQPLDIYVVSLTPGEGEHPFTVKFKGNNDAEGITATAGNYCSVNAGT